MKLCMFSKTKLIVEEKLNRSLLTSWFNEAADPKDPLILGYIDQCEAIGA